MFRLLALNNFHIFNCTEEDSIYVLEEMPPGKYLILANDDGKLSGYEPFPQLYYSNVFEKEKATVITIGEGENINNYDIHVPSQSETVILKGVLLYADSKPFENGGVEFVSDKKKKNEESHATTLTDSQDRFSIKILKGTKGKLFGTETLFSWEYEDCPSILKILNGKEEIWDYPTKALIIDGNTDLLNIKLEFPFTYCKPKKLE